MVDFDVFIFLFVLSYHILFCFFLFDEFSPSGNNLQETQDCQLKDESKDNRALVDNNKAQSLTGEDIDEMRR